MAREKGSAQVLRPALQSRSGAAGLRIKWCVYRVRLTLPPLVTSFTG